MAINPAEQAIYGGLFGSDAMRAIFDEGTGLARMLAVEAALARVQADLGIIPREAAEAIGRAARLENLSADEIAASTRVVGYPVVGLTKALAKAAGAEAGRYVHWGATTQDILDTALVLQIRDALDLLEEGMRRLVAALARKAAAHRSDVMAFNPLRSENDYWWDADAHKGADALIIADRAFKIANAEAHFAAVEKLATVEALVPSGQKAWEFEIWLGHNYDGSMP